MTEDEKVLVKQDLMLCLRMNAKLGDYQNRNAVRKLYDWSAAEQKFRTVIGKRYQKRLEEVLQGETDFLDCVLCNGLMMEGTAICPDCLKKYQSLLAKTVSNPAHPEKDTARKMTALSRQTVGTVRQAGMMAKEGLNTVSARMSEFAEGNEAINTAKNKLKEMADGGMEKIQENPEIAKTMEKGRKQAAKVRGKWRRMSKKKRIVVAVVCVLLIFGVIGNLRGGVAGGGGLPGKGSRIESVEDARSLVEKMYPASEYRIIDGGEVSDGRTEIFFNLQVGEATTDGGAIEEAGKREMHDDFRAFFFYIYRGSDPVGNCMVSTDGRIVVSSNGVYTRVR